MIENWAVDLHNFWPSPVDMETASENTLSQAFTYINPVPIPRLGLEERGGEQIGFPNTPPPETKEMNRFGGRFDRGGRFNRGGRDGWQYRKKEEEGENFRNHSSRGDRKEWMQGSGGGGSQDRQEFRQDQERQGGGSGRDAEREREEEMHRKGGQIW